MCGIATFGFGYPPLLKFYRLSRPNKGPRRFEESNLKLSILKINSLNVVLHFYPIFPNFTTQKRNHDQRFKNVQFCLCFCLVNLYFYIFSNRYRAMVVQNNKGSRSVPQKEADP